MQSRPRIDLLIADVARRQHGLVTWQQLRELGLSEAAISARGARGLLHRVHRAVYSVGHELLSQEGRYRAATLAVRESFLSVQSACAHLRLLKPHPGPVHVTTTTHSRSHPGITVHHTEAFGPAETYTVDAIPTTTWSRTLYDLADRADRRTIERVLDEAQFLGLLNLSLLIDILQSHPGSRATRRMEAILDAHLPGTTRTRSELEELFLRILDAAGIPRPHFNVPVPGVATVDAHWPGLPLIVELDGRASHRRASQMRRDRRRDARATLRGIHRLRFAWEDLAEEPGYVVATVAAAKARARAAIAA